MKKREQQKQERRAQILECGLDMLISCGYEATKIRDIAEKLGISTGLFFNYFESKEKLFEELVKIGISGPENVMRLGSEDISPIEIFEKMAESVFQSIQTNLFAAKMFLLMTQTLNSGSIPESVRKIAAEFDAYTPMIPIILKGQRLGQIKNGDPLALISAYWGAICGVAGTFAVKPDLKLPEGSWIADILRA